VDVLNASGRDGLARQVGQTLTELGFQVDAVGNTAQATDTVVRHSPELTAAAALLASTVPTASLQPGPDSSTGALELVLGTNFDEVVRRAPTSRRPRRRPPPTAASRPRSPARRRAFIGGSPPAAAARSARS
jgi:hypothetical protein